ncbi:unnamed protein product [marine sediment metagenome]|uniref:tyrosine--tRNA ligase n=1 Tax=marine sediment metagenome TaxID=412755 RepID=X0Z5I6_9ZZZZ
MIDNILKKEVEKQFNIVIDKSADVITKEELKEKLRRSINKKEPLRVKLGIDLTAPDIHLGHTVVLNKLRQFQDLGHIAILILGDYTTRIGDPSGRTKVRPKLPIEEIERNAGTFREQAFRILDIKKTKMVNNSKWLEPMKLEDIINITSRYTLAQLLERDDFSNRFKNNLPLSIMELLYPLMQAYDSVAIEADIELGGTDQTFNLLIGSIVEGGSTITQQYTKNVYFSPERKLDRKIKEAAIAYQLEKHFTKDKILEMYLNTIYFGGNAYGVEVASQNYFGKSAKDLNLQECALLAALIRSPNEYSPFGNIAI